MQKKINRPAHFIKTEKFKTKLRFKLYCNNVPVKAFARNSNGSLFAIFSSVYKGISVDCRLTVKAADVDAIIHTKLPSFIRAYKNGNSYTFVFTCDEKLRTDFLDKQYGQIPQTVNMHKTYSSDQVLCDFTIVCDKKSYTQLIGYRDKSLPRALKKDKWSPVAYKGISSKPLQGGGVSPR